jgi:hypothetical protein
MPLSDDQLRDAQNRVMAMLAETIATFELIEKNVEAMYGDSAHDIRRALKECLDDHWRHTSKSGETHPESLIYKASKENFQRAGFYGAQLDIKERQVLQSNRTFRERLAQGVRQWWRRPFKKWVDTINNFLGSLTSATGLGEAIKELKDCLRDELPDDDNET